jgi:hypothetical protein
MTAETPTFQEVARELRQAVDSAVNGLRLVAEADARRPLAQGRWSPQQVLGHLIDSAANNHQRFVRAQEGERLDFPAYAQDHWVQVQGYQECDFDELVTLWHDYNRHLSGVIARIPDSRRNVSCRIGANEPVTLAFLALDYVRHLHHHLDQLKGVASTASTEQVLTEIQQALARAWVAGDRRALERMIAPEWTATGPAGEVTTRQQVFAAVFEERLHQIKELHIDEVRVRAFKDTAIVTGRTHGVGAVGGVAYDVHIRFTDVFIVRGGQWQAMASHASVLPGGS